MLIIISYTVMISMILSADAKNAYDGHGLFNSHDPYRTGPCLFYYYTPQHILEEKLFESGER